MRDLSCSLNLRSVELILNLQFKFAHLCHLFSIQCPPIKINYKGNDSLKADCPRLRHKQRKYKQNTAISLYIKHRKGNFMSPTNS